MTTLRVLLLSSILACAPAGSGQDDAVRAAGPEGDTVNQVTWQGFLDRSGWLRRQNALERFALLLEPDDLAPDPRRWDLTAKGWIDSPAAVARLRASLRLDEWTDGQLGIDPTRFIALCFAGGDCYLAKIADVTPDDPGQLLLSDGAMKLSDDFRRVLEESYSLPAYSVYDEP